MKIRLRLFLYLILVLFPACVGQRSPEQPSAAVVGGPAGNGEGVQGGDPWGEADRRLSDALIAGASRLFELGHTVGIGETFGCNFEHPLCNELNHSPPAETLAAYNFIMANHMEIRTLVTGTPAIEYAFHSARPSFVDAAGQPRYPLAWTDLTPFAAIHFYEPGFTRADMWTRVAVILHELGHQSSELEDNASATGFAYAGGAQDLLDRMAIAWSRWAIANRAHEVALNEALIVALYDKVLGRPPTLTERRDGLVALIPESQAGAFALNLIMSEAGKERTVRDFYSLLYDRTPTPAELTDGKASLAEGRYNVLTYDLVDSDEYFSRASINGDCVYTPSAELLAYVGPSYSSQVGVFVCNLYHQLLKRTPLHWEIEFWVKRYYDEGANGRAALTNVFVNGEERRRRVVQQWYRDFLFREADPGGLAWWVSQLPITSDAAVRAGIAGSLESWRLPE